MPTFEAWSKRVNDYFLRITGLDRDSWPDQCYWDMWDSGMEPMEAVCEAIYNEYGEAGLEAFNIKWDR